jgi:hypothetical protein
MIHKFWHIIICFRFAHLLLGKISLVLSYSPVFDICFTVSGFFDLLIIDSIEPVEIGFVFVSHVMEEDRP